MDRLTWTEADERVAYRRYVGDKYALDDPEVLPAHLRDATRDPHWRPWAVAGPRLPGRHVADEEPSPVTVLVIPVSLILGCVGAVCVVAGVLAFRSLWG